MCQWPAANKIADHEPGVREKKSRLIFDKIPYHLKKLSGSLY
jgi:hypothetical protein